METLVPSHAVAWSDPSQIAFQAFLWRSEQPDAALDWYDKNVVLAV